jgi:hypothetical protein
MIALTRLCLMMHMCATLAGCAGSLGLAAGIMDNMRQHKIEEELRQACLDLAVKNIVVTEPSDMTIPTNEGQVDTFEPAYWQVEAEFWEGYRPARSTGAVAGTLAVTKRSILLVPSHGVAGVRIPYPVVRDVFFQPGVRGKLGRVFVKSCGGRLDSFSLRDQQDHQRSDPVANAKAHDQIDARLREANRAGCLGMSCAPPKYWSFAEVISSRSKRGIARFRRSGQAFPLRGLEATIETSEDAARPVAATMIGERFAPDARSVAVLFAALGEYLFLQLVTAAFW